MNRDDIIAMAREAGYISSQFTSTTTLERFAALVAAAEREACARACEERGMVKGGEVFAARIRARGEVETKTPDYLEKCPNCNGPADNGFDRSWPDPNPYFCTKCMKAMEY